MKKAQVCGWLKDCYRLSWQVAPVEVWELWRDEKSAGYEPAMRAMMQMKKLDIKKLKQVYEGERSSGFRNLIPGLTTQLALKLLAAS